MSSSHRLSRRAVPMWALGLCAVAQGPVQAADTEPPMKVVGIEFSASATLANQTLVLNGAGASNIMSTRATAVGLYLMQKTQDVQVALTMPGPKRLRVVALRDLSARDLSNAVTDRLRQNAAPGEIEANILQIAALGGVFGAKSRLPKGEVVTFDYLPASKSTECRVNGERVSDPIVGDKFFPLLMKVWVGPKIRAGTRDALMGLEAAG